MSHIVSRTGPEWDRPVDGARLLPFSNFVSLGPSAFPWGRQPSPAPPLDYCRPASLRSRKYPCLPTGPWMPAVFRGRTPPAPSAAYGWMPALTRRRCSHGYPLRVSPSAVDACPGSPQMYFPQLTLCELSPPLWMPAPLRGGMSAPPYPALRRLPVPTPRQFPTFRPSTPRQTPQRGRWQPLIPIPMPREGSLTPAHFPPSPDNPPLSTPSFPPFAPVLN